MLAAGRLAAWEDPAGGGGVTGGFAGGVRGGE